MKVVLSPEAAERLEAQIAYLSDVGATAAAEGDRLPDYEAGGFRIIFDSADGSLDVGVLLKPAHQDGKARIDQITLSVRGQHCAPDVLDR